MSYESKLNDLYLQRMEDKTKKEESRQRFRQSILEKQNKKFKNKIDNISRIIEPLEMQSDFAMPDSLPNNENKLKYLIFQNLELIQKVPERKKEAQANIKSIKDFINEQKKQSKIST